MNPITEVNERVDVVPIFYSQAAERLLCVPWKMKWNGREIEFTKLGMRHSTEKGHRMIHVFDVTDDINDYRLEFDAERLTWMLVYVVGERYV